MLMLDDLILTQGTFQLQANLAIGPGITAVIGPSGGGKSTLLGAIAGFVTPTSGSVLWGRHDLTQQRPGDRPVTMLFQDNNLFPHLTIAQNVGLALAPRLRLTSEQKVRVSDALALVGLVGLGDRKPRALSGGQQGRAALARTLLADRPLVLLDEAFAALGPALRAEMFGLVRERLAGQGHTVVVVTHDPQDAIAFADHVILVADNRAAPPQETAALFANPPDSLRRYLGI